MKRTIAVIILFLLFHSVHSHAQLRYKLQWLQDSLTWGVFVKPDTGTKPSAMQIIGSGQVTLVAPKEYSFKSLKSFSGNWAQNAYVSGPIENPSRDYISFGFISADPPLPLEEGKETLLFTFSMKSEIPPDSLYLIEFDDPFAQQPNSINSNPGNDISVLDLEKKVMYSFSGTYSTENWNPNLGKKHKQEKYLQGLHSKNMSTAIKP